MPNLLRSKEFYQRKFEYHSIKNHVSSYLSDSGLEAEVISLNLYLLLQAFNWVGTQQRVFAICVPTVESMASNTRDKTQNAVRIRLVRSRAKSFVRHSHPPEYPRIPRLTSAVIGDVSLHLCLLLLQYYQLLLYCIVISLQTGLRPASVLFCCSKGSFQID